MPYRVQKRGKKWAVVGGASGKRVFGKHSSKAKAKRQQRALYANTSDEDIIRDIAKLIVEEVDYPDDYYSGNEKY